jgi:hypothetical protein
MGKTGAKSGRYDAAAVGSVLHRMEAYGVVTRRPTSSATEVTMLPMSASREVAGNTGAVLQSLRKLVGIPGHVMGSTGVVERDVVAADAGIPPRGVPTAYMKLVELGLIRTKPAYNGKSTKWNEGMREKDVEEMIPHDEVMERRRVEQQRLNHVMRYIDSSDHRGFIREFFAKPT